MSYERSCAGISAGQIRRRMGCSTLALGITERFGAREISMIRAAGITRLEICGYNPPSHFDFHNPAQVSEIKAECRKQDVSIVSVHGPGIGFIYDTPYEELRKAIVKELTFCARVAEEMGASVFVTHIGMAGPDTCSERTMIDLLEKLCDSAIRIAVENGVELGVFADFVNRIGSDNLGMVVDIGHTRDSEGVNPFTKKNRAYELMVGCGQRLFHVHLHDFTDTGDHHPPFDGHIRWEEIFRALPDMGYEGEFMFEAAPKISVEDTLRKIAAFPQRFVNGYGMKNL